MKKLCLGVLICCSIIAQKSLGQEANRLMDLSDVQITSANNFQNNSSKPTASSTNTETVKSSMAVQCVGQLLPDKKVRLVWVTPANYQSESFIIERKAGEGFFEEIVKKEAKVSDVKKTLYSYIDDVALLSKNLIYKISEIKKGGKRELLQEVKIEMEDASATASVGKLGKALWQNNTTNGQIVLKGSLNLRNVDIVLRSDDSELSNVCFLNYVSDTEAIIKPMYELSDGSYTLQIKDGQETRRVKVTVDTKSVILN
jgi:hypothetical protein